MLEIVLISTPKDLLWLHPEIDSILEWNTKSTEAQYSGKWASNNLSRVVITNNIKDKMCLFIYSEELHKKKISNDDLLRQIEWMLFGDDWKPEGEPFPDTEVGYLMSLAYEELMEISMVSNNAYLYLDSAAEQVHWGPKSLSVKNKHTLQYKNFADYAQNDPKYFMKSLCSELHKPQSKLTFADGSTYHVTKAGSRYWSDENGKMGRSDGPAGIFAGGGCCYYLDGISYKTKEEWEEAVGKKGTASTTR
jgi:hypothetical protein